MIRAHVTYAAMILGCICSFTGTAWAHCVWQCGDAANIALHIRESAREPSPGTLYGPDAPHVLTGAYVALECAPVGQGLGTEWVCTGVNDNPVDLMVEVRRGRRTDDPWALATVYLGDKILADALPCTVEHVRHTPQ